MFLSWITFALERGVSIATVCNNCDTSIQYVQEHYFHYDAKRATDALATGRGQLKGATGTDWMRDPCVQIHKDLEQRMKWVLDVFT